MVHGEHLAIKKRLIDLASRYRFGPRTFLALSVNLSLESRVHLSILLKIPTFF